MNRRNSLQTFFLIFISCTVLCSFDICFGQDLPLKIVRKSVLSYDMKIQETGLISSRPYSNTSGLVWRHVVFHPSQVSAIRLHLGISNPSNLTAWRIKIKDLLGKELENWEGSSIKTGDLWTDELPGRSAAVELWTDADPGNLEITLREYSYRFLRTFPQSIHGVDDRRPIQNAPNNIQQWGNSIARLRFIVPGEGQATCTAFLVSPNLIVTNEHCINDDSTLQSAIAEFGYNSLGTIPKRFRASKLELTDSSLDYSILRLNGTPGSNFGKLTLLSQNTLNDNFPLLIIEHPAGEPKQVSIVGCIVKGGQKLGVGNQQTDFGHECDTLGGSSGSPTIDISNGNVIGLHHLGFHEGSSSPVNQAVYISKILTDIKSRSPQLYQEITGENP